MEKIVAWKKLSKTLVNPCTSLQ